MDSSSLAAAAITHLNSTNTETSTFLLDEVNVERPFFDGLHPMKKTVDGIKKLIGQVYSSKQQSTPISYQPQPQPTTTTNYQPQPTTTYNYQYQPQPTTNYQPHPTTTYNYQPQPTTTYNYQPQPTTTYNYQPQPTTTYNYQSQPQPTTNNSNQNNNYTGNPTSQSNPIWDTYGIRQRDAGLNSRLNIESNFGENRYYQKFKKE